MGKLSEQWHPAACELTLLVETTVVNYSDQKHC